MCGQCHSFFFHKQHDDWWQNGFSNSYRPGGDLRESRYLPKYNEQFTDPVAAGWANQIPGGLNGKFWPDGTVRLGGREYVGLIESSCYLNGKGTRRISCITCHSMHDYKEPKNLLAATLKGNQSCTQCHHESEFTETLQQHTHHLAASQGSRCINCHMPHTSYALLKAIRSHRIDEPNAETSSRTGRPNACNLCHLDRTLKWSSRFLSKWYQQPEVEMSEDEQHIAASVLWLLKGDAAQRVVTSWHLGWAPAQQASGRLWLVPFLAELLNDPYAAVRFVSYRSLRSLPGYEEFRYDFLADPSERMERSQQALELWPSKEAIRGRSAQNSAATLLNSEGEVNRSVFKRLLNQRDNRPVYLSE